jgi:hypothetical protein
MKEIWLQRDEDHSGFLERSEISAFFDLIIHNLGENGVVFKKDAKELVAEWTKMCDFNTDKRLSWDEFSYGLLGLIYPQLPPKVVGEEDKSPFIRSKIFFGDVQNRLKAFPDDEPLVEKWDHFELNPKIVGIKKLVITAGGFVDGFQVDYILDDGSIWSSPTHGKTDADNSREILFDENEFIVAIDGREGWWGIINQIALTIEKRHPDGSKTQRLAGPFGIGGGHRFSITSSLPVIALYGSSLKDKHTLTIGAYFSKTYKTSEFQKTFRNWEDAIANQMISYYYLPFLGQPGFTLLDRGYTVPGIESDSIEMVIEGFNELLSEEERGQKIPKFISHHFGLRLDKSEKVPTLLLQYDPKDQVVIIQTDWIPPKPPQNSLGFDYPQGSRIPLFTEEFPQHPMKPFREAMEYVMEIVEKRIGWTVKALKIIYCNDQPHRAYWKTRGDPDIFLIEATRNTEVESIKADIHDTTILFNIFRQKFDTVMHNAKTIWNDKILEYRALDKSKITQDQKNEYKAFFKNCKKEVHDTLEYMDLKYSLYHDRWIKLSSYKDYQDTEKNFHEILNLWCLSDEQITDLLLQRAANDEQRFKDVLNNIVDTINKSTSINHLCAALGASLHYYHPVNMMRKFIWGELFNNQKCKLLVGPLKTKDRGLVKVKETKDKTIALLDTLRATILCVDPVVPLIIIDHLKQTGRLTRVKNKTGRAEEYKCIHINFTLGGQFRTIYELQIVFEEYYDLQKKDHDYYEIIRVM